MVTGIFKIVQEFYWCSAHAGAKWGPQGNVTTAEVRDGVVRVLLILIQCLMATYLIQCLMVTYPMRVLGQGLSLVARSE